MKISKLLYRNGAPRASTSDRASAKSIQFFEPGLGFLHIVARDSFDQTLLEQLVAAFDRVKKHNYSKVLHVYGAYDLGAFDSIGIAPPGVAEVYKTQSPFLAKCGFEVFPMHGIEFQNGFSTEQFWAQRRRQDKWCVSTIDWSRRIELRRSV